MMTPLKLFVYLRGSGHERLSHANYMGRWAWETHRLLSNLLSEFNNIFI